MRVYSERSHGSLSKQLIPSWLACTAEGSKGVREAGGSTGNKTEPCAAPQLPPSLSADLSHHHGQQNTEMSRQATRWVQISGGGNHF